MRTCGWIVTATTLPNTTVDRPKLFVEFKVHSIDAGDAATRGGATNSLGCISIPRALASFTLAAKLALESLTCSSKGSLAMLMTNSPVARTLVSVSFVPIDVNCTIGGLALDT